MRAEGRAVLFGAGGAAAAFASALCCAGPLLAVVAGVSGAGLAATFGPLRPWFLGATTVFLLLGFWMVDREERKACEPGRPCAEPRVRRRMRVMLWIATGIAVVFATFPSWNGSRFAALGVQIAAGVPLMCDEPPEFRTFRIGLFGLDKWKDVDGTVARLENALQSIAEDRLATSGGPAAC